MSEDFTVLGKEVPVGSVEKELRLLWEMDEASTKASLINFVIFSEGANALLENSGAVSEITREHSCRAILLDVDRGKEGVSIRSWITAHCNLSGGKKAVCCEQLAFKIEGHADGIVRHTLFSHLDSDLPLVIWWQGGFTPTYRESFYSNVDRLIFDSSKWVNVQAEFTRLTDSMSRSHALIVQDLAWTRTYYFRVAIAAMIDHPLVAKHLPEMTEFKIYGHEKNRTSVLQILAWVITLAEYQPSPDLIQAGDDIHTFIKPNGGEVKLSAEYVDSCAALCSVEMTMGDCVVKVSREQDRALLRQQLFFNGETLVDRHCPADAIEDVSLITDQLSRGGKNSLFKRVLPQFLELI